EWSSLVFCSAVPPTRWARSLMPSSPVPLPSGNCDLWAVLLMNSRNSSWPGCPSMRSWTVLSALWRSTLVKASWLMRITARCNSWELNHNYSTVFVNESLHPRWRHPQGGHASHQNHLVGQLGQGVLVPLGLVEKSPESADHAVLGRNTVWFRLMHSLVLFHH